MPVLFWRFSRACSLLQGSPRWAILGPARLNRHPCRFTHCAEPPLGLSRGQENQKPVQEPKPKPRRGGLTADLIGSRTHSLVGDRLAGEPGAAVCLLFRVIVLRRQAWLLQGIGGICTSQVGFKAASLWLLI